MQRYNWNIVESGVKHHNPNPPLNKLLLWKFQYWLAIYVYYLQCTVVSQDLNFHCSFLKILLMRRGTCSKSTCIYIFPQLKFTKKILFSLGLWNIYSLHKMTNIKTKKKIKNSNEYPFKKLRVVQYNVKRVYTLVGFVKPKI